MFELIPVFFLAWPVIIVVGVLLSTSYIVASEDDSHTFAIIASIIAGTIYCKPLLSFAIANWQMTLLIIAAYGIVGGIWSVFRWFKHCKNYVNKCKVLIDKDPDNFFSRAYGHTEYKQNPEKWFADKLRPSDHKSKLIGWITYWPWSLLWNIVGNFITSIYDVLVNIYQKTANMVIKQALKK